MRDTFDCQGCRRRIQKKGKANEVEGGYKGYYSYSPSWRIKTEHYIILFCWVWVGWWWWWEGGGAKGGLLIASW